MNSQDRRRYDLLIRVRNFGAAYSQLFPATSSAHGAFAVVAAEVQQLEALDVTQRLASHSARAARKVAARKALVDCLTRAKNTARVLVKTTPSLAAYVELPQPVDDRMLLTIARQFVDGTAPHAEQFATHGIEGGELDQRVKALESALNERGRRRDERAQARHRIDASLARAFDAVETLDVAIANHLTGDAATLTAWKRDRRLYRPKRLRTDAVSVEPVVSAGPEASPAPAEAEAPEAPTEQAA